MGAGHTSKLTITLAIDRIDADGSAHAATSAQMPGMSQGVSFESTITPAGAILAKYDPNKKPHVGMSNAEIMALAANAMAQQVPNIFGGFNAFAASCAQRTLKVGDSWTAAGSVMPPLDVVYTVTGRQTQQGHDVFAVSITNVKGSTVPISGQAYYDPSAHLVVGYHTEIKSENSAESETTDVLLHP